jgi:hypothetical protein
VFHLLDESLRQFVVQEAGMVLKKFFAAVVCVTLLGWNEFSLGETYRAEEYLRLDLSRALLSPKTLGPATQFAPVAIQDQGDGARASAEPKANSGIVIPKIVSLKTRMAHVRLEKSHRANRSKLARVHGNPLDAQAFDTRIQVWPCRSGGICQWRR